MLASGLAFSVLGEVADDLAQEHAVEAIREKCQDEEEGANGLNLGILCCVPKGEGDRNEQNGRIFTPSQIRPLSLIDVTNRLNALSYK